MTASAERRRRRTVAAGALAAAAALLIVTMTAVGATSLANSRAGRDATAGRLAEVHIPATPTAMVAVVDDEGRVTSVAAVVLAPAGVGGSIVPIPAVADSTLGLGEDRHPLSETLEVHGAEAFVLEAEVMTALSFDVVELVTAERFVELFGDIGPIEVDLPVDVFDDAAPEPVAAAGPTALEPSEVAAVLTAFTAHAPAATSEPARIAVWEALAASVGDGTGTAEPVEAGVDVPTPADLDGLVGRLLSGPVGARALGYSEVDPDRNPRDVDAVVLDRAELLLVFAQIAPSRVAAPNESLTFRIEADFAPADLDQLEVGNADVARDVIHRLLFVRANVVSVVTGGDGEAPDTTQAFVSDERLAHQVEEGWSDLLGDVEVHTADFQIPGVDAVIVLGRSYLDLRVEEAATGTTVPGGLTEQSELGPSDDSDEAGVGAGLDDSDGGVDGGDDDERTSDGARSR